MDCEPIDPPPTEEEKELLKRLTGGIIRVQGNRFIKELLRSKKITLGRNKDEFEDNLVAAIDRGCLALDDVRSWLAQVEGWGDQHVYLYRVEEGLAGAITVRKVKNALRRLQWEDLWEAETESAFPDEPALTSVSFDGALLRMVWQEGAQNWKRDDDKTYQKREGLDLYEFRAFRQIEDRVITRFEVDLGRRLAALLVPQPIRGKEHTTALRTARDDIGKLLPESALRALDDGRLDLSVVARNIDQTTFEAAADPHAFIRPQRSRLRAGGSYVEFGAQSDEKSYSAERAVRAVRDSIRTTREQEDFRSEVGVFLFGPGNGLERRIRAELHRSDHRIRFKAQMERDEVWQILTTVSEFQFSDGA